MYVARHSGYPKAVFFLMESVTVRVMTIFDMFHLFGFFFPCRNPTPLFSFVPITTNLTTRSVAFQALADPGETARETPLMLRYKCN